VTIAKATAKKTDAGAIREMGLAEADVLKAKGDIHAQVTQSQAEAEAEGHRDRELAHAAGIEAKGLAEAKSIEEKAKAMKLLHAASQQHEEFRLRLAKDRDVDLASINVQKDIATANASVVAEALRHAKIDLVGGDNTFFERIVKAISAGKSVERFVSNSETVRDIKNTFFNGDPEHFKNQMRQWIDDYGVKTEDVKNLTVAALLTKLMATTSDSATKSLMAAVLAKAKDAGLADAPAAAALDADVIRA